MLALAAHMDARAIPISSRVSDAGPVMRLVSLLAHCRHGCGAGLSRAPRPAGPCRSPCDESGARDDQGGQRVDDRAADLICEIPAPPFKEERRAAEMKRRFESLGLANVRIDSIGNVLGEYKGKGAGPTVTLNAHLDTVFPEGTDVTVTKTGTLMKGPGIGDDCRGLATILAVARALKKAKVETQGTIIFIANVGEEGPGNLRGIRYLFKNPPAKIDYFVAVDGTGLGIATGGVGSNRYKVSFKGPGGHSYGAFGMPSPIHALGRAIAKISEMRVPTTPKTTFNVGVVEGGTSVNTISPLGAMDVDLRSESAEELARLDAMFRKAVADALKGERPMAGIEGQGHGGHRRPGRTPSLAPKG